MRGIHQQQLPIVLYTHQVAVICFAYVLGGDKYRASLVFKFPEMIPKLAPQDGINPSGRLVQEEQLRVVNQRGRQAETPQHPPRNIAGQLRTVLVQLYKFQGLLQTFSPEQAHAIQRSGKVKVFPYGQVGVEHEKLWHIAKARPLILAELGRVVIEHDHLAIRGGIDACQ